MAILKAKARNELPTREEFERLEQIGVAYDGSPIRREPFFGHSVWDDTLGWPVTPIAYAARRSK